MKDRSHRQGWKGASDPIETMVESWLMARGVSFTRDHVSRLDFYLPDLQLFIECKRFTTPRIADQLARVPSNDVIVVQGIGAFDKLRRLLGDGGPECHQIPRHPSAKARGSWHEVWQKWGPKNNRAVSP